MRGSAAGLAVVVLLSLSGAPPLGAETAPVPLESVHPGATGFQEHESVYNYLRRLPTEGPATLDLPGGSVQVTVAKGRTTFAWEKKPHGIKVRNSPRGATAKIRGMGLDGEDMELLVFLHPEFGFPFVVNAVARRARVDDMDVLLIDADLDGRHDSLRKDAVLLRRGGRSWALPLLGNLPLGDRFGRPRVGDGPEPTLEIDGPAWTPPRGHAEALAAVNAKRILLGLEECTLDEKLCEACRLHCRYLHLNGVRSGAGKTHVEDPALPGYTEAGARAAANSVIWTDERELPEIAVDFLGTFYHRAGMLDAGARRLGMAHADGNNMIDVASGSERVELAAPLDYPAHGQFDLPLEFQMEWPNPVPEGRTKAGFPISVNLPGWTWAGSDARATLEELPSGRSVPVSVSSPAAPAHAAKPRNRGSILVLPLEPLRPHREYAVRITWEENGLRERAWHFFTGDEASGSTWR